MKSFSQCPLINPFRQIINSNTNQFINKLFISQNISKHMKSFYNKISSTYILYQSSFRNYSVHQGSHIVLYAWSDYLAFRLMYQQHSRTYRFVLLAQVAKLYTLLLMHKPTSYHHVVPYTP